MDDELQRYRIDQAHAYLERIRKMGEDCAGLQEQVDDAYSRASGVKGIDYSAIRVQTSVTDDAMVNAVASIKDRIRDYAIALSEYEDMRHDAFKAIQKMDDFTDAKALRYRYLCGWKWEKICTVMNYSWDGMMKIRRRALCSFYDFMPLSERDAIPSAMPSEYD